MLKIKMAFHSWRDSRLLLSLKNFTKLGIKPAALCKNYSMFPPTFKDPVFDKKKVKEILESQSKEELSVLRFKPALNYQSCSVFYDSDVELLTNFVLREGNRDLAKELVRDAFTYIKHAQLKKYKNENDPEKKKEIILKPIEVFRLALKNVTPLLWYCRIKRSGTWYKIPVGITEDQAKKRALKWLVESSDTWRTNKKFSVELAKELLAAAEYQGKSINKKIELHKMCEANRSYAHYWWT